MSNIKASLIISFVVVVVVVLVGLVEAEDSFRLYNSRTSYDDARNYLSRADFCPSSFGPRSLEDEHRELIGDSCEPVVFYLFGRHAARY